MRSDTLPDALQIRANRLDVVGRLADDLSHEVKNPLHAMVINLELVRRRAVDGDIDECENRIAVVENEIHRVHRLMDSLLRLLRPARAAASSPELDAVIEELLPVLEAEAHVKRVDLARTPAGDDCRVRVDPVGLRHAVLNLFVNAIEAVGGEGGRVRIDCERTEAEALVRVRGSGPGVAPEVAGRLGEAGVADGAGPDGYGLAVARAIAAENGGELRLESEAGTGWGTSFVLAFPRHTSP